MEPSSLVILLAAPVFMIASPSDFFLLEETPVFNFLATFPAAGFLARGVFTGDFSSFEGLEVFLDLAGIVL